jgi:alkanesulfonate monooxygenase SsuD/methylene tetrahydromethanopterin reductase-like flavin-dependent oxidoreductase (luciferase family)
MDESLEVIRGLTDPDGGFFEYHGKVYDIPAIKMTPRPGAPLPILVGGHGPAALRRAAQSADGWLHGGGDPSLLPDLLGELGRRLDEAGRPRQGYEIHVISMDAYSRDGVRRLEEQGVTDVIVGFRWPYVAGPDNEGLSTKLDNLRRFADQVIHKG